MPAFILERLRKFNKARNGNAVIMFALGAPILIFGIAVAIDFSNASIVKTKLNEAADAAALAGLTPAMMAKTNDEARTAVYAMFDARAKAIGSLVPNLTSRNADITNPNGLGSRMIKINWSASTNTIMGGVLHQDALSVAGTSTAQASTPPNINFYLLLDNSPSMALPASAAGIAKMESVTVSQDPTDGGCAFACHQGGTNISDTVGNLCTDGSTPTKPNGGTPNQFCDTSKGKVQMDNYAMARYYNITLRLDELTSGITTLMNAAYSYQTSGIYATAPVYQFAAYSMNTLWSIGVTNTRLMDLTANFKSGWSSASSSFGLMEMWQNNYACGNSSCTTKGANVGDVQTNYDNSLSDMLNTLPTPGNGTNQTGDKPQEVLFFVTDGVEDESYNGGPRIIQTINGGGGANVDYCAQIKAKGVKIAILYTEYLALPTTFYATNIAPFQSNIGPKLQACASPNLYSKVTFGDNMGAALSNLFNTTIQQAALAK